MKVLKIVIKAIIVILASGLAFVVTYIITPQMTVPIMISNSYIGRDGEIRYQLNLSENNIAIDNGSYNGGNESGGAGNSGGPMKPAPVTNHQHVSFKQTDAMWGGKRLGTTTIGKGGCGLCSFAAMMAEAGYRKTPDAWLDEFGDNIHMHWGGGQMQWSFPPSIVNMLNSSGKYGTWSMCGSNAKGSTLTNEEFASFLREHLGHGDYIMASSSNGLFTSGGHIILIVDLANSSDYFHVCDSSGRAAKNLGISYEQALKYSFPVNSNGVLSGSYRGNNVDAYHIKALWAFHCNH